MERIDHAAEAIRIIDACLAEEETAIGSLRRWCEVNGVGVEEQEALEFASHAATHTSPKFYQ